MKKYLLELTVFISGAVVMILELVGSRVIAPYLGTSIMTWTSLIGVILASLSVGYWFGGRLADRNPNLKTYGIIICLSGVSIGLLGIFKEGILQIVTAIDSSLQVRASIGALILFGLPSALLGMVSPYAARLRIKDIANSGSAIGSLYAISTVGSIVGTFTAGFFLIAYMGTTKIIFALAAVQVLVSLFVVVSIKIHGAILIGMVLISVMFRDGLSPIRLSNFQDLDTSYSRVWIYDSTDIPSFRPVRNLVIDAMGIQSAVFLDKNDDLVFPYTKVYRLVSDIVPDVDKALMIGGGAYTYPQDFVRQLPDATIDVVEIDPGLTQIAEKYFGFRQDPRIRIFHEDGRIFLNHVDHTYDAIFVDAFGGGHAIPYQLTTKEAIQREFDILNPDGVVFINIISTLDFTAAKFLLAEYKTYRSVFPFVELLKVTQQKDSMRQNVMMVAGKKDITGFFENPADQNYGQKIIISNLETNLPVLTDEYAPVEVYIASEL